MIAALVEGLLPGLRSLRPPIFAGIGWSLLFWILLADDLPLPAAAVGWLAQVYGLATFVGPIGVATVALVLIFLVGAIAQAATEPLARAIGRLTRIVQSLFTTRLVFHPWSLEWNALLLVRQDQLRQALNTSNSSGPMYRFSAAAFEKMTFEYGHEELTYRLQSELSGDPLDSLRQSDKESFDDLQRDRSERAVRLAISFPLVAIGIFLGLDNLPAFALAALGLVMMVRFSANLDDEQERTIKLLMLRGGSSPAFQAARALVGFDLARYNEILRDFPPGAASGPDSA